MGNLIHLIHVKTGDKKGDGDEAKVRVILVDAAGTKTDVFKLDLSFADTNTFEQTFPVPIQSPDFGAVVAIELWKECSDVGCEWYCEVVTVSDRRQPPRSFYFPVHRWMKPDVHHTIDVFDTSLPQDDPRATDRAQALEQSRAEYQYKQNAPGMPVQIKTVPSDEKFSFDYKWDFARRAIEVKLSAAHVHADEYWESLDEMKSVYNNALPPPACVDQWSSDAWFGAQRLKGCNPDQIRLCEAIPEKMRVIEDLLLPFLEEMSLQQVIEAKRLFYVDLKILEGIPINDAIKHLCAPIALFFVNRKGELLPIAIQLQQDFSDTNPVFLPSDPPYTWIIAKMWFNNADSNMHQSKHLGMTHLLMEGVYVSMQRTLSSKNAIFKLLAPHFIFIIAINNLGIQTLMNPGGFLDKFMSTGRLGLFEVVRKSLDAWSLDVHCDVKQDLQTRGVLDPDILPIYPYREDALMMHKAIETYVTTIVRLHYDSPEKVQGDWELQSWAKELSMSREDGGVGIQGVPGGGKFATPEEVVSACVAFIFRCSVQHSAYGSPQYDEYGFSPNYPGMLTGAPPTDRSELSAKDMMALLPNKEQTIDMMTISRLLSVKDTNSLGDYSIKYLYQPEALAAVDAFRDELRQISKTTKKRAASRSKVCQYDFLNPDNVPNSISI